MLLDYQVQLVQRVRLGLEVFQGLKGHEGLEVDLESVGRRAALELQGSLAELDSQGCQDPKDHRAPEELQDLQVWKDHEGLLDLLALLVLQGYQGYLPLYLQCLYLQCLSRQCPYLQCLHHQCLCLQFQSQMNPLRPSRFSPLLPRLQPLDAHLSSGGLQTAAITSRLPLKD